MIKRKENEDITRIALFMLFDALVFHEALASYVSGVRALHAAPTNNIIPFLKEEWEKIMDIDYEPVFSLSYRVLDSFPSSQKTDEVLRKLINAAQSVVTSYVLMKHDLMGRIYHKLLLGTTGKYYATYYTSIPAAWLLANLCIQTYNPITEWDFSAIESIRDFKVIDPACGSGTLLSAVYLAIKNAHVVLSQSGVDLDSLHKVLLEECIHGWDILDYATHLSLTTLALHNHKAMFLSSNLYTLPIGIDNNGNIHLGSLDFLSNQTMFGLGMGTTPTRKNLKDSRRVEVELIDYDLVIMNPPFSRAANPNLKFGYKVDEIRKRLDKEVRKVLRKMQLTGIGQAGMGALFIFLGNILLKPGGRLAFVIPRSFLSGVSWEKCRNLLLEEYYIEYIISNHDPGASNIGIEPWNWSENTDIGEVLIIARKGKPSSADNENNVTYINLWNKPRNEVESIIVSHQCIEGREESGLDFLSGERYRSIIVNEKHTGTIINVPQKILHYNFLFPCLFAHAELNKLVYELMLMKGTKLTCLKDICSSLGRDIKQIKEHFQKTSDLTPYNIVWGHLDKMNTIYLDSDEFITYGRATANQERAERVYLDASDLLISDRLRTDYHSIVSYKVSKPVLATALWEIKTDAFIKKMLSLWLNSTPGLLMFLSRADSSQGPIYQMKKANIQDLLVPDPTIMDESQVALIDELYNRICMVPFNKFFIEFCEASKEIGARYMLDKEISQILEIDIDWSRYYEIFCEEPIFSLKRL